MSHWCLLCPLPSAPYCAMTGLAHPMCSVCANTLASSPFCPRTGASHGGPPISAAVHDSSQATPISEARAVSTAVDVHKPSIDLWQSEIQANYREAIDNKKRSRDSPEPVHQGDDYFFEESDVCGEEEVGLGAMK